ncbi:MAG: hypothetical protein KJ559_00070 [Nanoarchaeota archaeon]|nr:hypothetical protein [Nanoarchaeota archaeon]
MRKTILIFALVFLFVITLIVFFDFSTGKNIKNFYIHTKAICDEKNYCQDYEITCLEDNLVNIVPITGASIQHKKEWKDPRNIETRDILCFKN